MTCLSRACSFLERREGYKTDDFIALKLVPSVIRILLFIPFFRHILADLISPYGIYEYVIARTKYFDEKYCTCLKEEFEQIVIFGAGFDSRAIRFDHMNKGTKIFELDSPITQRNKITALNQKKIPKPAKLEYIAIDFNQDSLKDVLIQHGFRMNQKTLFLMEGIIMYLPEIAVDSLFQIIKTISKSDSLIIFDYIHGSVLKTQGKYVGEKEIVGRVIKAGEPWLFGIEEGKEEQFLHKYNLELIENNTTSLLEQRFFQDSIKDQKRAMNGTHAILCVRTK